MAEDASRYIVGIDLGTTNSAVSYVDTSIEEGERNVRVFPIPQLIAAGEVAERDALPSFVYLPESHEVDGELLNLTWSKRAPDLAVGEMARAMSSKTPHKVVSSAKSWLCYEGLDRRSDILPWDRGDVPRQISPVQAARLLLAHIREAWNARIAEGKSAEKLEKQEVYLTVPASFDAVARELTVEAAEAAGLSVTLLEEPQAAFYSWLQAQGEGWRDQVEPGQTILVCDIGGGTTDFSLIAVVDREGDMTLDRVAVGEHILLGGDNMDLALAYGVAERLRKEKKTKLDAYQIAALTHACRGVKEKLTGDESAKPQTLTILGRGSSVIGGTIKTKLAPEEIAGVLVDGFFPTCKLTDQPAAKRKAGLRSFGLDYAADPAVTKHLAAFLERHAPRGEEGELQLPAAVLFNGGVTKAGLLRERIVDVLRSWRSKKDPELKVLEGADADLAVARGSAWYGNVKRTGGVRIKAGSPRSYYIGIESSMPAVPGFEPPVEALCVVPFGMEEGTSGEVAAEGLGLLVGEQTEFRFFTSTIRNDDAIGRMLEEWEGALEELPPLVAELPAASAEQEAVGSLVPVKLETVLTEHGTLQLWCRDTRGEGRWKLEFELRDREEE
jgi:molecular chaperone DnaK (HSP70)